MHINTLLHHLFLHRTAQQARHYLCFSRVCLYAQRGGRMCGCEALKCESLRKLSEILRRTPIVYRNHGPKFRKPRHCFCHRPQSKQELQSTSCHRGTNLCATVLCLFVHLPCAQPLDCTQDTCAACIFCTVRLVLVLHELQVVCHKRLCACRSCVGLFHIYTCPLHVQAFSGP